MSQEAYKPAAAPESATVTPLEYAFFVLRSARTHAPLCIGTALVVAALGIIVVSAVPSIYGATSKVYLQSATSVTSALTAGHRINDNNEKPKPVNAELVLNRANVLSLVREANLINRWRAARTWPFLLKDQLQALFLGEPSREQQETTLAQLLSASIFVNQEDQSSVRFTTTWREPQGAFLLARLVQRNFFKDWQADEMSAISRAASLLEEQLKNANNEIAPAIRDVQLAVRNVRSRNVPQRAAGKVAAAARRDVSTPLASSAATDSLPQQLEDNRRRQRALLEPWQHRLAELKSQLVEMRVTYGPEHPLVRQQEARVQIIGREPEELAGLRAQESLLLSGMGRAAEYASHARAATASDMTEKSSVMQYASIRSLVEREQDDPEVSAARIHLDNVLAKCRDLEARLDAARMELAATQISFKYRYKVVEPPDLPTKPLKATRLKLIGGVAGLSLVLGLLAGAARELLRGRVLEAWQIKQLGVPVLAEVELRGLRRSGSFETQMDDLWHSKRRR